MAIYQWYEVKSENVEIKFVDTLHRATLINANFTVMNMSTATPTAISNPFKAIDISRDFSSISRVLTLWWDITLSNDTDYRITIANLNTINGAVIDSQNIDFSTGTIAADSVESPLTREPVDVEDYSIKNISTILNVTAATAASVFNIESVTPDSSFSYYLDPSHNEGKIEITFSLVPAANFVSNDYFKVQRKAIGRGISRWEDISALVTSSANDSLVVIYLPSIPAADDVDQTSYYAEPDLTYWEEGYKYRLRISGDIGPAVI